MNDRVGLMSALVGHVEASRSGFKYKVGEKYIMKFEKVIGVVFLLALSVVLGITLAWWVISTHLVEAVHIPEPDYTLTTLHVVKAVSYTDSGDQWDIQPAAGYKALERNFISE